MLKLTTSINFDFVKLNKNKSKMFKEFEKTNIDDVVTQLKQNIVRETYFDKPISPMTRSVRLSRGNSSPQSLIESKTMINSIKKKSGGKGGKFQVKKYGVMQNDGYLVNDGRKHGFYSPKKGKTKLLYQMKPGTKVPARPWLIYKPKTPQFNLFMKKFMKYIKIPMKNIKTTTFKL